MKWVLGLVAMTFWSCAAPETVQERAPLNQAVLVALQDMPQGGGYSGTDATKNLLPLACRVNEGELTFAMSEARPSFCSGATYLVFLKAVASVSELSEKTASLVVPVRDQNDGEGVFGRWNANGPGCAKLVADLGMGENFTAWERARRGDFLKIWWNEHIGRREQGHHVVYLKHDAHSVTFWSSNQPKGYGVKTVPRAKCQRVLFTRIDQPHHLQRVSRLSARDPFLAEMLQRDFTWKEVLRACQVKP